MNGREELLKAFMEEKKNARIHLMPTLHKAREIYGEIDIAVARMISEGLDIPMAEITAAASFYSAFNGMDDGEADDRFLFAVEETGQPAFIKDHPKGFASVKKALRENTDIIKVLGEGKILGKSGSGFPVSKKWELTRDAQGDEKYIICNGSEGEGNTYKDYYLFCKCPKTVIEGMILCSIATGISQGYIYVRLEYEKAYDILSRAVKEAYEEGALGRDIFGSGRSFDLEVILGGGAYVSGEETGLLQALEGKRGEPRLKPPFPGVSGLYGKPTIINNAESFAAAAALLYRGQEEFLQAGTQSAGGSKLYTVCGCVKHPGIYEAAHHVTFRDLIVMAGGEAEGKQLRGFQIGGGATGSFGDRSMLDTVLDYGSLREKGLALGTASILFFSEEESVPALALKSISFLKDQSCGLCTACKYGLEELTRKLERLCAGDAGPEMIGELSELCGYIASSSRCALGQASPTALTSAMKYFLSDFEALCGKEDYEYDLFHD